MIVIIAHFSIEFHIGKDETFSQATYEPMDSR